MQSPPATPLDIFVNCLALVGFLGFLVFMIRYGLESNWRKYPAGRSLMYAMISINIITLMATVHLFTGRYPGIEFVRMAAYSALALSAWRLVFTLHNILYRRKGPADIREIYGQTEER